MRLPARFATPLRAPSRAVRQTASFFTALPKAKSANAAVDACGIPDGFSGTGAITSMSSQDRFAAS
jgi:hypothetical protein